MKHTFDFLKKLNKNNNREWFSSHKSLYEHSYEEIVDFAGELINEMNNHDTIETASAKKSLFRIYRDVRFSKDKTPYKNYWSGRLKRATSALRGGYYYHIQPGNSFVMGGFFGPNAGDLLHIRKQIDLDSDPFREIIESSQFRKNFGELLGSRLKTAPKGFERDHPDIDLLQLKQFMVKHIFNDEEVLNHRFPLTMAIAFQQMRPFFDYMSEILTTDLNGQPLI